MMGVGSWVMEAGRWDASVGLRVGEWVSEASTPLSMTTEMLREPQHDSVGGFRVQGFG